MHKSQFRKIDTYEWFCGPGSHMKNGALVILILKFIYFTMITEWLYSIPYKLKEQ